MSAGNTTYGSDVIAAILDRLDLSYATLNPGASYRGLHESLVATGGPEPITSLFEGANISIAHGYAKSAGRPMAALVHNLVGLQHASMGVFNAYSDGVPMMIVGGSGPTDRSRRRPWIDWVHTPATQGSTVRSFTKFETQPVSLEEIPEAFARAYRMAVSGFPGPAYVAVDAIIQEDQVKSPPALDVVEALAPTPIPADHGELEAIASALASAESPLIIADNLGRTPEAYRSLIDIAEHLAVPVVDLGGRHSFPNTHWADATFDRVPLLAEADVVLCLDPRDTRWALTTIDQEHRGWNDLMRPDARLFVISLNELRHTSFIEVEPVVPAEIHVTADTKAALPALARLVLAGPQGPVDRRDRITARNAARREEMSFKDEGGDAMSEPLGIASVYDAIADGPWELAFAGFRNWVRRTWELEHFNAHLGGSGGAGLGYAPGAAIGAALAHRDDDTLVASIQPDGDLLYNPQALWTAAHHRLPMLMVVIDNGTYAADRIHQARMSEYRGGRSTEKAHIGVDFDDPRLDIAGLAEAQGVQAWTVKSRADIPLISRAVRYVRDEGLPAVIALRTPKPEVSGLG